MNDLTYLQEQNELLQKENANLKEVIERVGRVWAMWVVEGYGVNGDPCGDIQEALEASHNQKEKWLDEADDDYEDR